MRFTTYITATLVCTLLFSCAEDRYVGYLHAYPGLKDGRLKAYTQTGLLREIADYHQDTLHGERMLYDTTGQLRTHEHYEKGRFHGSYTSYYMDGTTQMEGQYVYDEMVGVWTSYYPDGVKKAELTMKDNMENGPFTEYYTNGVVQARGHYKGGDFEDGELLLYDSTGVLVKRMDCEGGKCWTQWTLGDDE